MKQWLSKFRSQRLKDRYGDGVARAAEGESSWWNQPVFTLLIGLLPWLAACVLLQAWRSGRGGVTLALVEQEFMLLVFTFAAGMLVRALAPAIARKNTRLLVLALCALTPLIPATLLLQQAGHGGNLTLPLAGILIPFALAPLLAGVLLGVAAALIAGLWATLACLTLSHFSTPVLVAGLIATAASARLAPGLRRRTQLIRTGLMIGVFQLPCLVVLQDSLDSLTLSRLALGCLASGLGAALLTLLLLPLFESLSGLTSNMTLLELSDLGHPLLQQLAFAAPGTYHHSLTLATLAQAAADEIGANSILARVGAYYHDIGKITKAGYFTENIRTGESPHDDLAPSMSALLVMAHIKEGLTLAVMHKLPSVVVDMIQQHHGTGLVVYFHQKAGRQATAETLSGARGRPIVDESSYRYPGPKPLSREAAILMLADSVEAASRSLDKPSPMAITELVDRLVDAKLEDRQLDQCEMTLAELCRVKRSFVFSLTNMLHSRIAYPRDEKKS